MGAETESPGLTALLCRLARTVCGVLHNRAELFTVEWQQERARLTSLAIWGALFVCLVVMALLLLSATVILTLPEGYRIYAAAGFAVAYLAGAAATWLVIKRILRQAAFSETLHQLEQDRQWLDSFTTRN